MKIRHYKTWNAHNAKCWHCWVDDISLPFAPWSGHLWYFPLNHPYVFSQQQSPVLALCILGPVTGLKSGQHMNKNKQYENRSFRLGVAYIRTKLFPSEVTNNIHDWWSTMTDDQPWLISVQLWLSVSSFSMNYHHWTSSTTFLLYIITVLILCQEY
jgi:hypothetical protein